MDRHAGTPDKTKTKDTISSDYSSICYIASRIVDAGVQLNFMWCGVGKTNHNDEPYIKLVMFFFTNGFLSNRSSSCHGKWGCKPECNGFTRLAGK